MENKKVLLTNFEITQFSGSEITITSIASQFKKLGYTVYMASLNYEEPLFSSVKTEFDVIINLFEDEFDFSEIEFDIVWSQHTFLLDSLIFDRGLKAKKIVASSLSPFESFESMPVYSDDLSLIIANSVETKKVLQDEGIKEIELFENFSYTSYFENPKKVDKLKKIAIVSNHIPEEMMEALELLKEKEYIVDIYGLAGQKKLITDEILKQYDAIISIGKTVQYAMSLKIPVYIYDRFGGPGYLRKTNIEENRMHNFSGRGYSKNTPENIVEDIISNYSSVIEDLGDIHTYAYENFCFEENFSKILSKLEEKIEVNLESIINKYSKYKRKLLLPERIVRYISTREYGKAFSKLEKTYVARIELAESDNKVILSELKKVEAENKELRKKILLITAKNEKSKRISTFVKNVFGKK